MQNTMNSRFPIAANLDSLRGIAILGVITVHTIFAANVINEKFGGKNYKFITDILNFGQYGVEVFFFLSGVLISSIYPREKFGESKSYWTRRILRILPLWIMFVLIQLIRSKFLRGWAGNDLLNYKSPITFIPNYIFIFLLSIFFLLWISGSLWNSTVSGGWSIQSEIYHYLFYWCTRKIRLNKIIEILLIVNIVTYFVYHLVFLSLGDKSLVVQILGSYFRLNFYSTIFYFVMGVIISERSKLLKSKTINLYHFWKIFQDKRVLTYAVTTLFLPLAWGTNYQAIIYLILMLVLNDLLTKIMIFQRAFIILGRYSYFMYFIHFYLLGFLQNTFPKFLYNFGIFSGQFLTFSIVLIAVTLGSLLLAIPSWTYFESRFINLGKNRIS